MPKRSDRDYFSTSFEGNPYEDMEPVDIYKNLQWGNNPNEIVEIDAPEPIINLGELASLVTEDDVFNYNEKEYYLAIGSDSNLLYIIPITDEKYFEVPDFDGSKNWKKGPHIKQTDYYSSKGGEESYYYHEHENPFPQLWIHKKSGIGILIPSNYNGKRSYVVINEGIVG